MNKGRRKLLAELEADLQDALDRLGQVAEDEREAFESMPENLRGSPGYDEAEQAAEDLDEAVNHLDEALSNVRSYT